MTTTEFSDEFDILLNSYNSIERLNNPSISIEVNEYEKSIFLTKAQEEVVIGLYSGKNYNSESFEETEEVRRYLSALVKTYTTTKQLSGYVGLSTRSVFYKYPEDLWFITYESATLTDTKLGCMSGIEVTVIPVEQDDFYRINKNPFKGPSKRRVLRLDNGDDIIELVSNYTISRYLIRYMSKLSPIILIDLSNDGLTINNSSEVTECKLNPVIHRIILKRAVEIAVLTKTMYSK